MAERDSTADPAVRLRVAGWLRTLSPLHVGAAGQDPNAPLAVAVDGRERLYVPGSSLAGALRSMMHNDPAAGDGPRDEAANRRWGWAQEKGPGGTVSRIVVRDAPVATGPGLDSDGLPAAPLDPARLEMRTSVGIDRRHGTAAQGFLFTRTVIPQGALLRLELDLHTHARRAEQDRAYLSRLLMLLADGQLRLGGAVTRGLGRTRLAAEHTHVHEEHFGSPQGLFAALHGDGARTSVEQWAQTHAPTATTSPRRQVAVQVRWRPAAPVMVRSGTDGLTVDTLPLTTAVQDDAVTLVLPGTALKGALRSRAEHIERTARGTDAPAADTSGTGNDAERSAAFRAQLDQLPAVRALFGSAPRRRGDDGRGRGALIVDDCHAEVTIPAGLWDQAHQPGADRRPPGAAGTTPPDGEGASALERLRAHGLERADHVAIDRWTGGAAEGLLYSVLEPHGLSWQPITLTLDLGRLATTATAADAAGADAALALLLLVLRDLKAGRLPLGGATNRGMGDVTVEQILLTFPEDEPGHRSEPVELDSLLRGEHAPHLTRAWCAYLDGTTE
ncbi:RAMP superfamily CRISPR-associated protein [Streptomyces sp. AVP053U2]|uniref:RAMP superfamily CRISPR-associated protein n=1 Tax=Streptomyces sp. AVP053U2 TaxID=1737066 RepID=UPI00073C3D06|nr:RAMP superfamily CRISPR-associated protein [Streptomyces sp. AVP053U2]ODA69277.1 RAMP superfamily protein [Streptomyces sp. AVP053U2]